MAPARRYTVEEVEAMDPADRAAIVGNGIVTDLDNLDPRIEAMMDSARPDLQERLGQVTSAR